jgi:hypothetical protein
MNSTTKDQDTRLWVVRSYEQQLILYSRKTASGLSIHSRSRGLCLGSSPGVADLVSALVLLKHLLLASNPSSVSIYTSGGEEVPVFLLQDAHQRLVDLGVHRREDASVRDRAIEDLLDGCFGLAFPWFASTCAGAVKESKVDLPTAHGIPTSLAIALWPVDPVGAPYSTRVDVMVSLLPSLFSTSNRC